MIQNKIELKESLARVKERGTVTNYGWLKVRKNNIESSSIKWLTMIEMDTITQRKRLPEMEREEKQKRN